MTRKSKRELERALDQLYPDAADGPTEIVIQDYVVPTDWGDDPDAEKRLESRTRLTRDAVGKWHTEREDVDE
ncbi:hypothetical protein [Haloferax sp. Q22]|uniref:hypothetical protein n=1 Tax=Haloferax sp. (strain Q22) TaxID=1526048 RepID=UPI000737B2A4|nr:hypothetical protein [Haloferax sp. Q22]